MTVLSRLIAEVRPHAPTAPALVVGPHLRRAAADFCKRTRCWRHIVKQTITTTSDGGNNTPFDALPIEFGVYPEEPALATAAIHELEKAWFNGYELDAIAYADRTEAELTGEGLPKYVTQVDSRSLAIAPLWPGELRASLFLRPSTDNPIVSASFLPERIADQFGDAIVNGALGRLLAVQKTAWYEPQLAMGFKAMFEEACDENFAVSKTGQQRSRLRSRTRFFL